MAPLVEGLEKQYDGKVEFRKLNVETDQSGVELANKLGVQYVPTFLFVNSNGVIAKQVVGEQTSEQIVQQLDALQ
jgi:thioredoxin-like negative regulator of GroEL